MYTHGVCAFHPQGKRWSHADFTEGIAVALLAFATASKTILKPHWENIPVIITVTQKDYHLICSH